jgi:hypothetical protein
MAGLADHLIAAALALACAAPLAAQERRTLGFGRLFSNDYFGDGRDRWHTGSYVFSVVRGPEWQGRLPERLGAILEYRLRTEIIAPARVVRGRPDRPYVGALSVGLHSHAGLGPFELSAGADLTAVGPQTRLSAFHEWYHELLSMPRPLGLDSELGDAVHATFAAELAWPVRLGPNLTLRPYAAAQTGVEDLWRIGADVILGRVGQESLMLRDVTTGTLYRGVEDAATGFALIAGADWTQVKGSAYLPESEGFLPTEERTRARIGVHWQIAPQTSFYYGVTWLSEEFVGQPEGQLLGSLKLNFNF